MTTTANEDWVKYAAEYEAAKLARENEMFVANEQYKTKKAQLLERYAQEDKRAQGFLGRLTNRESDTEIAAKRAIEAVALESEHKNKSQSIESKYPQPTFKEWLVQRDANLARKTYGSHNTISNGEVESEPQLINSNTAKSLLDFEYRRGSRATKDENHIHYHPRGDKTNIAFTDTGRNIEIYKWEETESLLASLQLASQKWDKLRIDGDDAYKAECVKLAVEHGFKISNPELQDAIRLGIEEKTHLSAEREKQLQDQFGPTTESNQTTEQANLNPTESLNYEEGMPTAVINRHKGERSDIYQRIKIANAMQGLSYGNKEPLTITKEIAWLKINEPESDRIALLTSSSAIQGVLAKTVTNHDFYIASEYYEKQYEAIKHTNLSKEDTLAMDHEQLNDVVKQQSIPLTPTEGAYMSVTTQQSTQDYPFLGQIPEVDLHETQRARLEIEQDKMEKYLAEHPEFEPAVVRHPQTGEPLKQESALFVNEPNRKEMVSWESENDQWVLYQQDENHLLITPFNESGEVEGLMYSHNYTTGDIIETQYEAGVKHGLEVLRNQIDWLKHDENFYEYGADVTDAYVRSQSKLPKDVVTLTPEDDATLSVLESGWNNKPSDIIPEYSQAETNQLLADVADEANEQRVVIDHENDVAHNAAETAERKNIASAQTSQQKDVVVDAVNDIQADVRATKSEKTHDVSVEQQHAEQEIVKWTSKAPKGERMAVDPFSDDPNHGKRKSIEQANPENAPQHQAELENKRTNKR